MKRNVVGNDTVTASFDFFDSSSAHDLTLSPQTLSNTTEALINDNSDSLGLPADNDTVSTTTKDDGKPGRSSPDLKGKRPKTKPTSPNRQGPQQCTVCSKVFGNASALAKHKLTHSDERKYICTVCNKAFKRQDHLNGHMLTHRNKKPYECKADGCGKSYCDARSLRRHTENHHVPPSTSSSSTTMSPAQGAAAGDAASPHGSSCIQYAPPPTGSPPVKDSSKEGKSQLQQLLSTEPAKCAGRSNDGLTKEQLDLIHQIMEQTQRQNQVVSSPSSTKPSPKKKSRSKEKTVAAASSTSWSPSSQQQQCMQVKTISSGASSPQSKVTTTTPSTPSPTAQDKQPILKPVECNLCKRRFKNIPALNGHMRLHGGYFKKDPDTKKLDKKEQTGPPLQTASSSVRALIEEKIINKRNSSPSTRHVEAISHTTSATQVDMDHKHTSFVVPAPPHLVLDKHRRHSDAEALKSSKSYQEAQAIADLIVKREKICVKRTTSDPGQAAHLLQYRSDSFSLDNVEIYQDERQFVTPSLEDEVFSNNTMMIQGVDPSHLSQISFQSESLDDNLLIKDDNLLTIKEEGLLDMKNEGDEDLQELSLDDIASLHEEPMTISQQSIQIPVNQELQAVLNSPLPESLAEFSTYHSSKNLEIQSPGYPTHSPGAYARSPHTFTTQSPLQSPMIRHDSPGFAYPTPPASHEGQSPCFGQNMNVSMVSPNDDFGQMVERGIDEPPQASSPLSAAFYTSTMSSSAAVEEAIQEILPGESINEDNLYPLSNTPPSQSENDSLGLTPVPSPRVTTSMPSPHPSNTYSSSPKASSQASALPQWGSGTSATLMLPNSEDPLLSSQPKDFVLKKRIQLNGVPVRLLSNNGLIELNGGNFTGLLVDANGELKLIQTSSSGCATKNFVLSNAQLVTTSSQEIGTKDGRVKVQKLTLAKAVPNQTSTKIITTNRCKIVNEARREECNDVFLSPTTIPTSSPIKQARKRLRTEPLQLPVFHQSKLRTTRSKPQGSTRFTPQPILNPQRPGSGLYANIKYKFGEDGSTWGDPIPETDSTPHINIGPQNQCTIPTYTSVPKRMSPQPVYEDLLWDPGISSCTDSEVDMYLEFACCAAIPGGGRNKEYAMHLLHMCGGNIHDAMLRLMQPSPHLPADHPLLAYSYSESDKWTSAETELFHRCLLKFDKDFIRIAEEVRSILDKFFTISPLICVPICIFQIKSKSVKQCIQFYYVWKKVCSDEYSRLKALRQMKRNHRNVSDSDDKPYPDVKLLGIADSESPMRNFLCEYPDCSASFNSRAALNGHIRIHGGTARNSPTPTVSDRRNATSASFSVSTTICHPDSTDQEYPCKICGKVFSKIKSRSAHMKSHRPPDAEPSKRRNSELKEHREHKESKDLSSSYEPSVPSPFSL
ncbi:hypothetical protein HUJ04_004954 [Dendroctonus ponderosae]|nr:hypothetical protein HUJ04_004954 [Dendroctonus ponderosae]